MTSHVPTSAYPALAFRGVFAADAARCLRPRPPARAARSPRRLISFVSSWLLLAIVGTSRDRLVRVEDVDGSAPRAVGGLSVEDEIGAAIGNSPVSSDLDGDGVPTDLDDAAAYGCEHLPVERDGREAERDSRAPVGLDLGPPSNQLAAGARTLASSAYMRAALDASPCSRDLTSVATASWISPSMRQTLPDSGYKPVTDQLCDARVAAARAPQLGERLVQARRRPSRAPRPLPRRTGSGGSTQARRRGHRPGQEAASPRWLAAAPPLLRAAEHPEPDRPSRRTRGRARSSSRGDPRKPKAACVLECLPELAPGLLQLPSCAAPMPSLLSARAMASWSSIARASSSERPPISRRSAYLRVCRAASARTNSAIASSAGSPGFVRGSTASSQCARARS